MEGQDGTTTRRNRKQDKPNIMDPRSESRKNFTKVNIADPRPKLAEIPIKAAKERRQKKFNENRGIGNQEEEKEIHIAENINNKQIIQLVKQLSEALKQFEMISRREIENIKMQMELKIKTIKLENDKITKDAESLVHKIEEIKQSMINQEINKTTQKQHDREYYIHNQARLKNGLAMLKMEENKYIRVPVIPKYKYNKYSRKWIPKYFVQSMTECITFEEFINKNSNFIIRGRKI